MTQNFYPSLNRTIFYGCFLLVFISLIACKRSTDSTQQAAIFRYNESSGILTLDPAFAKDLPHIWVGNQLFNGLVALNERLETVPAIAKSWEISDDGLTYTFHLNQQVFFHENEAFEHGSRKVKAADFVYSFNRLTDPRLASPGKWIFNLVEQSEHGYAFSALNDSTFQIRLSKAFPPFLGLLSMTYASVVPHEAIEYYGRNFRENPVGTGPFRFQYWKEGVKLVLLKNERYFEESNGQQMPFIDGVSISFLVDKQIAFLEFIKGSLDFMSGIDARYKDELLTKEGKLRSKFQDRIELIRAPFLNTEYIGFQVGNPYGKLTSDQYKALRKAINYAIDREKMLRYLRNGIGHPGWGGMIPIGMPGYDSSERIGYRFNLDKAKSLVNENQLQGVQITLSTTAEYVDLGKFVQAQANETGIDMQLEVLPPATIRQLRANGSLAFFRGSWVADYPDAENYLSLFYSENLSPKGPNYTRFTNPQFDQMYERMFSERSDQLRFADYVKMDSLVMDDAAVVVLFYDEVLRFVHKRVQNLGSNPINLLNLKQIKIEKTPVVNRN